MKYDELMVRTSIYIYMRNKFMRINKMQDYVRYVKCTIQACLSCLLFACELTELYAYPLSFPSLIVSPS
ncbi:Serine/threonine-protein kinase PLK1 [Gossypium arboreum]|uniref:Serine/threonine-protein kinase PLK1 n=1 Tax=Gossypium arboreum TaxID=29729 RepID=A0A0B0MFN6_GOSAR|nr:Serine/threonine-protein kinase PLK1 [Gossypium arboreum]